MDGFEYILLEVAGAGDQLVLDDGSVWEIAPEDRDAAVAWTAAAAVSVDHSGSGAYPVVLYNPVADATLAARPLDA